MTVTFIVESVSLLSPFMNQEDKRNPRNWIKEERDRVVGLFDLLIKMDKKQNPDLYKLPEGVVLHKDGNHITFRCSKTVEILS